MLKLIIVKHLNYTDLSPPLDKELPSDWLLRLIDEAQKKGDWERVSRVMDIYRTVVFNGRTPAWFQGDYNACNSYLAGQKLEKAAQCLPSVIMYQNVLKTGEQRAPIKEATDRLAAISKDHPDVISDANKMALLQDAVDSIAKQAQAVMVMQQNNMQNNFPNGQPWRGGIPNR